MQRCVHRPAPFSQPRFKGGSRPILARSHRLGPCPGAAIGGLWRWCLGPAPAARHAGQASPPPPPKVYNTGHRAGLCRHAEPGHVFRHISLVHDRLAVPRRNNRRARGPARRACGPARSAGAGAGSRGLCRHGLPPVPALAEPGQRADLALAPPAREGTRQP